MLRGSTATATAETNAEFAWRTDAGSLAGRWRLLQSERGVQQLSDTMLLAAATLSPTSLRHAGIGHATHSANRNDRLHPVTTATSAECDRDVTAAWYARSAYSDLATPSATASSSAAASRGPDDRAPSAGHLDALGAVNVQL